MYAHVSILVREVMDFLQLAPGRRYVDGTLGGGGHSEAILTASGPDGQVVGLDRDDEAIAAASDRLKRFGARLTARQASFADAREVLTEIGWDKVDGVILDLGVSSRQIDAAERGFSFRLGGRLDMRMDRRQSLDACRLVNTATVDELMRVFRAYGEEPQARRIAEKIAAERKLRPIESTDELARLVEGVKGGRRRDHHPATQVFQALRIAVNQELDQLEHFLDDGFALLRPNRRMVIISFHSLEDRLVKNAFRKWSRACLCPPRALVCQCGWSQKVKLLTKRPLVPGDAETAANPRARSAKLRAVERI
ncbi:MAG TPA: 16S rRNA (cytosine(1402)-N(4))-methyltransferase RsmH [Candidatus Deferrimicrobium sp.]|nr:16S rRNA (cytosine(1402)-N(4))-methyltransferase RsmH [Candidatus Deferrimicrobium sp.]